MDELNLFIKTIMLEAWFKPEELFEEEVEDAKEILIDRLTTEIMLKLGEDDVNTFVDLASNNPNFDLAFEFAKTKINDFGIFIKEKMAEFRLEYLERMSWK